MRSVTLRLKTTPWCTVKWFSAAVCTGLVPLMCTGPRFHATSLLRIWGLGVRVATGSLQETTDRKWKLSHHTAVAVFFARIMTSLQRGKKHLALSQYAMHTGKHAVGIKR